MSTYDVVVVGAGPAGLSAALMLGRCRRRVVVIDDGAPRNRASLAAHGFLTRDGAAPAALLRLGRAELAKYPTLQLESGTVVDATGTRGVFRVRCRDGREFTGRRLLLATGVVDELPPIDGLAALYGRTVHHCPFCDAYEYAGRRLVQYGRGRAGVEAALLLRSWTDDVVLVTDGAALDRSGHARCERGGVRVREERIRRLVGRAGRLQRIEFSAGRALSCAALFFASAQRQRSDLAERLGCMFTKDGAVMTTEHETTNVPGLYVAGDASHREQKVVVAAAEGTQAAIKIHISLSAEDLRARGGARRVQPVGGVTSRRRRRS
ncbi:MAG TPA: NAD(P)/FAD-dependent oxidoreductase [Candidatus Limnocylindria bacterium]|nr:NAD(P)/FAD-dependent oxidoreductase [Candidatus Limnocylindria bacterium]